MNLTYVLLKLHAGWGAQLGGGEPDQHQHLISGLHAIKTNSGLDAWLRSLHRPYLRHLLP
jgi:hypothetical protein